MTDSTFNRMVQRFAVGGALDESSPSTDTDSASASPKPRTSELEGPLEALLIAGGDSRIAIDPTTGLNRYGIPPRPRPEAVEFSSSTASSISEHGYRLAELVRRDLLAAMTRGTSEASLRRKLVAAITEELLGLTGLANDHADVALTASGTDAELLTVLLAAAGAQGGPVTNILIAPEESGKGVALAASGRYFDDVSATRAPVRKGALAVPHLDIRVREIAVRDSLCRVRPREEVDAELLAVGREALSQGHRVLAHVLFGSKTGLVAPSCAAALALLCEAPERVDIVVDACQMRSEFAALRDFVEYGFIVQASGSKVLTGPPFSGALLLPATMRTRIPAFGALLAEARGAGHAGDWAPYWAERLPKSPEAASFGPLFRWLPALLEATLYVQVPVGVREQALDRFRAALLPRILGSPYFRPLGDEIARGNLGDPPSWLTRLSIISFQVLARQHDRSLAALDEAGGTRLFQLLNQDVSPLLPKLSPADESIARRPCHLGQPVTLRASSREVSYLRLVLGARFFNTVGHAPEGASESALEAEISDATHLLEKLELLAEHFGALQPLRPME